MEKQWLILCLCLLLGLLFISCEQEPKPPDTPPVQEDVPSLTDETTDSSLTYPYPDQDPTVYDPQAGIFGKTVYTAQDSYEPWYLDTILAGKLQTQEIPDGYENNAVMLQKKIEIEQNGVRITIEFFEEYVRIGSVLQAKATITNLTDADIVYVRNNAACDFHLSSGNATDHFWKLVPDALLGMEYETEDVRKFCLPAGQTTVVERATQLTTFHTNPNGEYTFQFCFGGHAYDLPYEIEQLPADSILK
jgi:hypothetical protein